MSFFSEKIFNPEAETMDRRKNERIDGDDVFRVDFHTAGLIKVSGSGHGKDISLTGIRFATQVSLKKGDKLEAVIYFHQDFPGVKKINMQMQVARIYKPHGAERFRVGVAFLESPKSQEEFEIVRQFVWWLQQQIL